MSEVLDSVEVCVDRIIERVGADIVLAAPLGLGKPVQLINAIYRRVAGDASLSLHILTALCLEKPRPASPIEEGLAGPIMERLFGDYEELDFLAAQRECTMPANIKLSEIYVRPGSMKNVRSSQQNYISSNYTHIARDMLAAGVNVMAQMVAVRERDGQLEISLSSNPDITLELLDMAGTREGEEPFVLAAQTHEDMPFMEHDAQVSVDSFDWVVHSEAYNRTLFAVPNAAVPIQDYATALHASSLIADGGTLQIGIGALGDAVAHACILRQEHNDAYQEMLSGLTKRPCEWADDTGAFDEGLYVSTEMFVNGMMHLVEHDIVKRRVYDSLPLQLGINSGEIGEVVDERLYNYGREQGLIPKSLNEQSLQQLAYWGIVPEELGLQGGGIVLGGQSLANDMDDPATRAALLSALDGARLRNGRFLHGGFFLGPREFYDKLSGMDAEMQERICMTGVRRTNQLLLDYHLYCAQRSKARFINTGMIASLNGAVASDALEDGTVISGVGGQYNFVAMAHDLPGARSILCIRSTRGQGKQLRSNILPFYGYTTIPKHLRDVIVTEYGVADLRGQSDAEVIKRMINIADSRFQQELLSFARNHGKLPGNYSIPASARNNTPQRLYQVLKPHLSAGLLPHYPFGTDMTEQEIALAASLRKIKALSENPAQFIATAFKAVLHKGDEEAARPFLERLRLEHPGTTKEFLIQQLLMLELEERGLVKVG